MFNKYGKKVLSLAMASAMVASMAIPAFADDETTITAVYSTPTLALDIDASGDAQINPYGLPYEFAKSDGTTKVQIVGQQIATKPVTVKNKGTFDLTLGATVTATTTTGLTIVNKAPTAKTTEKQAFVQLQVAPSAVTGNIDSTNTTAANKITDDIIDEVLKDSTWDSANSLTLTSDTAGVSGSELATLKATKDVTSGSTTTTEYQAGSIALIRLTGTVTESPTTAWSGSDKITVKVAYTFKPVSTT
jgi:hypothetical protein